jgi:hypothetical protein
VVRTDHYCNVRPLSVLLKVHVKVTHFISFVVWTKFFGCHDIRPIPRVAPYVFITHIGYDLRTSVYCVEYICLTMFNLSY